MLFHKYDAETKIYIESVDLEVQPENSTTGELPETTDLYTIAFIENEWFSVLKE